MHKIGQSGGLLGRILGSLLKTKLPLIVKNGENVLHLKIDEVVLIHCNIIKSIYHHDSRVLYTFVPNRSYGQFFGISPKCYILKKINSECSYFEVWFTDQSCKPIEIEDKINTTLVIN